MTITLGALKKNHEALIAQYIDLLNEVSKLPFFALVTIGRKKETATTSAAPREPVNGIVLPVALRYLVRLFTESHIRGKLVELSKAYLFLAQGHAKDRRLVTWLKETSADCEKLAATLSSWQSIRGIIGGLWPIGIGIVTAWFNLESVYDLVKLSPDEPVDWVTVGLVIFPLIYVVFFIGFAFQKKREMFLRGFVEEPKLAGLDASASIDNIVYHVEDQVFDLLGWAKVREFPTDVLGQASVGLGFAAMSTTVWIVAPPGFARYFYAGGVVFFLVLAIGTILQLRWRKWK